MNRGSKKKSPTLVSMGLMALDVVIGPESDRPARLWAGGTCGNVTAILSFLDWKTYPVARLGSDFAAEYVSADLKKWSVDLKYVDYEPDIRTPVVIEKLRSDKHGQPYHRFSFTCPSCGAWLPSYRPVRLNRVTERVTHMEAPDVFFFDRVSPAALYVAAKLSSEGSLVFFEPSGIGDPRLFQKALQVAHVVKYSHERVREIAELRSGLNPILEIETLGEDGLRYRVRDKKAERWSHLESLPAGVVKDTAGAGDWCTAGVIFQLGVGGLDGLAALPSADLKNALRYGQALAAWSCRYEGPRGGMYQMSRRNMQQNVREILAGGPPESKVSGRPSLKVTDAIRFVCLECVTKGKSHSTANDIGVPSRRLRSAAG